jgi:hypothetical protein
MFIAQQTFPGDPIKVSLHVYSQLNYPVNSAQQILLIITHD